MVSQRHNAVALPSNLTSSTSLEGFLKGISNIRGRALRSSSLILLQLIIKVARESRDQRRPTNPELFNSNYTSTFSFDLYAYNVFNILFNILFIYFLFFFFLSILM